jgi:hypothetical protein
LNVLDCHFVGRVVALPHATVLDVHRLLDSLDGRVGELLILEYWCRDDVVSIPVVGGKTTRKGSLRNANSSKVRPDVSGNMKYTKQISKASQQQ